MSTLSKVFPRKPILDISLEEFVSHITSSHDIVIFAYEQFHNIELQLEGLTNLLELKPLLESSKEELSHILHEEHLVHSTNFNFTNTVKSVFARLKAFFMKLFDAVVAFFRRMFAVNVRTRHTLTGHISKFYKNRALIDNMRIEQLSVYLINSKNFEDLKVCLVLLVNDLKEASKTVSIDEAIRYSKGLESLGYIVRDRMILQTASTKRIDTPESNRFISLGWDIETYIKASQVLSTLCLRSEEADSIKNKLENEVKAGLREVDRLTSIGDVDKATALNNQLNDLSLRSSYVFKCAVILQSYVEHLSIQFLDTWENINNLSN